MTEEKQKNKVGRPSELAECLVNAKVYLLEEGYKTVEEEVPTIAGLACYLGKSRSRVYEYGEQSSEFKDILDGIMALQECKLVAKGLKGEFNSTIVKLMLTKHGYSDKQELTGANGGALTVAVGGLSDIFEDETN